MNSFESDFFRAVTSRRFFIAVLLQIAVLQADGFAGTLHRMSVPLLCTLPYAGEWLDEYRQGFVRFVLCRCCIRGYILGKFFACVLSGALAELLGVWIFSMLQSFFGKEVPGYNYLLVFLCAALWAAAAATLAALSDSKYIAYGGSFVLYYFLVILYERYWKGLYCLYPYEWLAPAHTWVFGSTGTTLLLTGLLALFCIAYYAVLQRRLENV